MCSVQKPCPIIESKTYCLYVLRIKLMKWTFWSIILFRSSCKCSYKNNEQKSKYTNTYMCYGKIWNCVQYLWQFQLLPRSIITVEEIWANAIVFLKDFRKVSFWVRKINGAWLIQSKLRLDFYPWIIWFSAADMNHSYFFCFC